MKISEWRLKMRDGVSATLSKLSGAADKVSQKFNRVQEQIVASRVKMREAADEVPYFNRAMEMIKNPFVALVAGGIAYTTMLGLAGGKALTFEEGMAKVNATTQLQQKELIGLRSTLMAIGRDSDGNFKRIPETFEQTVSLLNDIPASLDVVRTATKGAKAGFTDIDIVAKGLATTMSIVGKENVKAMEVLDTFQQAKNLGAGEFEDFASYMPRLIAAGKDIGLEYKEVAGLFSFMTTQASDASDAAMLMQNAFSVLGRADILKGLAGAGVNVFDKEGSLRSFSDIFKDLNRVVAPLSDQGRALLLDKLGLRDQQARQAFSILIGNTTKLNELLEGTANSAGAVEQALKDTANPMQRWRAAQDNLNFAMTTLGYTLLPLLEWGIDKLNSGLEWISQNSELLNASVYGLGAALAWLTVSSGLLTKAVWANTLAWLANPMVWIPAVIMAIVTSIVLLYNKFEWFRGGILGIWEVLKGFGNMIKEYILDRIQGFVNGISALGKMFQQLRSGQFEAAWETGKQAASDIFGTEANKKAFEFGKNAGEQFQTGYQKGVDQIAAKKGGQSWLDQAMDASSKVPTIGGGGSAASGAAIQNGIGGISGGGKEIKSVTVNIQKLVENIKIEAKETGAQMDEIARLVEEALIRAVRGGELAISNDI